MGKADTESAHRNNRTICLPFSQEIYDACIKNPIDFRIYVDKQIELFPELFPVGIDRGYQMKDTYHSKKQSIPIRRRNCRYPLYDSSFIFDAIHDRILRWNWKSCLFEKVQCPLLGLELCFWSIPDVLLWRSRKVTHLLLMKIPPYFFTSCRVAILYPD